jgi:hypothetical protein
MATYRAQNDNVAYLYAGTFGLEPSLWRSPTGDPSTWERVWTNPTPGSIRSLALHDDLLYIAVTHELAAERPPGEIYATDGTKVWLVDGDGFGNPANIGVYALASFDGWLHAGTMNIAEGYEVWKLAGPDDTAEPIRVIANGGPSRTNQAVSTMLVFQEHLYVAALSFAWINTGHGSTLAGGDMVRIDANGDVETVVGPDATGGVGSGFGKCTNIYLWSLAEHDGKLYCGTWDWASLLPASTAFLPLFSETPLGLLLRPIFRPIFLPNLYDLLTRNGGELYCSSDGLHWDLIFFDGLGDPDNYGVRTMVSAQDRLFLGMANIFDGLQIWRSSAPQP